MSDTEVQKRITYKCLRPNPLFQSWLEELYSEAIANNSKLRNILKEALDSIAKYPLPLSSGAECAILKGFDKNLCLFLDRRLETYRANKILVSSKLTTLPVNNTKSYNKEPTESNLSLSKSVTDEPDSNKTQNPKEKEYKPRYRTGGYAILIGFITHINSNPDKTSLTKEQLIDLAQPFCEESLTRPKPECRYTAWSSMSTLITKGLVDKKRSKKVEYCLTDEGYWLALELLEENAVRPSTNDIINEHLPVIRNGDGKDEVVVINKINLKTGSFNSNRLITMQAGTFDVILLIDKQETSGVSKKNDPTVAQFNKYPDLKYEFRHLKVGDFLWIARDNSDPGRELVIPYIIERKRMDDLGASIKDGRFHEQKFRLRKCGLQNAIYLIENYGSNKHVGLPLKALMQAISNTRVQDGFKVHVTDSLANSARFLAMMTKRLTIEYKDKDLKGRNGEAAVTELMTFNHFNKASSKNKPLTVTETFIKLLLQMKGVSVDKALAITNVYKTPKSLIEEYKRCSKRDGEMLLANLKYGELRKNVGPNTSKAIYQLFTIND